jgi:hypothetical protein
MSRSRRLDDTDEQSDHEDLWGELAERVCRVPGGYPQQAGDPQRAFHQDLALLSDRDLLLEQQRAIFRACLERNRSNIWWLQERVERIESEQERRRGLRRAAVALHVTRVIRERPRHEDMAWMREEILRELEGFQHGEWLRHQEVLERARDAGRAPGGDQRDDRVGCVAAEGA